MAYYHLLTIYYVHSPTLNLVYLLPRESVYLPISLRSLHGIYTCRLGELEARLHIGYGTIGHGEISQACYDIERTTIGGAPVETKSGTVGIVIVCQLVILITTLPRERAIRTYWNKLVRLIYSDILLVDRDIAIGANCGR